MPNSINPIKRVKAFGQSIWYDNIQRSMFSSGALDLLIKDGVMGITSNPTIFEKAINGSSDYDNTLISLLETDLTAEAIFEKLAVEDIQTAADFFKPIYQKTKSRDGFISLEVRPTLAYETKQTIDEALRLWELIDRPNVMIKVPATPEGIPAIETLTSLGINVNVTLIFSISQYQAVSNAYVAGLEKRLSAGNPVSGIASVASFFLSRIDSKVDARLEKIENSHLQGKIAISSAKVAYAQFKEIFSGKVWENLAQHGARVQRPLWASTSTKNPDYPDTLYVESLIGPDTVNTVPPATLEAFKDHGEVHSTLETDLAQAVADLDGLRATGINLDEINIQLMHDGVVAFRKSYETLLKSINEKARVLAQGKY